MWLLAASKSMSPLLGPVPGDPGPEAQPCSGPVLVSLPEERRGFRAPSSVVLAPERQEDLHVGEVWVEVCLWDSRGAGDRKSRRLGVGCF